MTERGKWPKRPEWLDDARRGPRWADVRTALARVGEEEYLGKLRDVSPGGLGMALKGVCARPGETLRVAVVFDEQVLELEGRVSHARPTNWGSLVGISWAALPEGSKAYLSRRYGAPFPPKDAA